MQNTETNASAAEQRYARGWNKLREIDGEAGERVIAALAPVARQSG
ncbi:hypothetical protein GWC77_06950 [Paraburkholderia sp. NMBU_R16]|nr:hypothetical protein [Paraburkholderia sp. NMBU_R16]